MVSIKYKLPCILYAISLIHASQIKGLDPKKHDLYKVSTDGQWTCLDGSKTIAYSAINDDYCDCPDGSDEPGTSACPNSFFYCANVGHIPAYIKSTAVNDGVCDEACCDGSDENGDLVTCPNRCKEVGEAYRKEQSSLEKSTKAGLQAKKKLVDEAAKQVIQWEEEKTRIEDEIFLKKAELLRAQRELKIQDAKERKTVTKCSSSTKETDVLKQTVILLQKNIKQLEDILSDMKRDHNQNYHDMAVKGAITAYDEFVERYSKIEQEINSQLEEINNNEVEEEAEEFDEDEAIFENDPFGDEKGTEIEPKGKHSVLDILYEKLDSILPTSIKTGFLDKYLFKHKGTDKQQPSTVSGTRKSAEALETEINDLSNSLKRISENLEADFGPEKEWLKLKDTCIEKNEGEYTYSFCFLGDAYQKSNKDNNRIFLGKFAGFEGKEDKYNVHSHTRGTRCWNGPDRSVKVFFECGTKNEILTVTEPEKCEYHFTSRSPAVCKSLADIQ